jgi:hypothetical protein
MPVPTYHLDDGPSSHAHSPVRKSVPLRNLKSQGFPAPVVPNTVFQNQAGADLLGNPGLQMPYLDSSNIGSVNVPFSDPFTDSAYLEWANSVVNGQPGDSWDGLTMWPTNGRDQKQRTSDTVMPDYVPPQPSDPMHISGPSLEDEPMSLKVPTNTPTGGTDDGQDTPLQTHPQAVLPSDFASSLTRSLLNQPFPLPVHHHNPGFPVTEAKSSKDKQHAMLGQCITVDTSIPPSASSESSCGDFGSIVASLGCDNSGSSLVTPSSSGQPEPSSSSGRSGTAAVGGGKGNNTGTGGVATKRPRNFTPASVRVIDEEDEPRRPSPHVRAPGFGVVEILSDAGQ